jgi:hypothetical protein
MATDIIQLPPDSTGKKIAARSYTEGANTVYAQAGYLTTDNAGGAPAEVSNAGPQPGEYGLSVRPSFADKAVHFYDGVEGAALNTNLWGGQNTTMTITQASGFINLNAGAATTINTNAQINSIKSIPRINYFPIMGRFACKHVGGAQANAVMEIGFGVATARTAPTDGAFFRYDSTGLKAVINYGGTETASAALTAPAASVVAIYEIILAGRKAQFLIDGVLVATLTAGTANASVASTDRLPIFARVYTGGTIPATAPQLSINRVTIVQADLTGKSYDTQLADSQARNSYQSPATTFGQTAQWANSAAPATATLSNTAASYTTLGGLAVIPATVGAATDYALFAYQIPTGFEFHMTGILIMNPILQGAAMGTTATYYYWGLGLNSSAASLATADALGPPPTAWGPRRVALGAHWMAASAAIGTVMSGSPISMLFMTPIVVDSTRFIHVILRIVSGVATASAVLHTQIGIFGYFE